MNSPNRRTARQAEQALHWHGLAVIGGLLLMLCSHWWWYSAYWFYWLGLAGCMSWVFHYCVVKSVYVDEDWADERARDLRLKSYDLGHIGKIRGHYIKPSKKRE